MRASLGAAPQYFGLGTSVTVFDETSTFLPCSNHGPFEAPAGTPWAIGQPLVMASQLAFGLPLSMTCFDSNGDEPLAPAKKPFQSANGSFFLKVILNSFVPTASTFSTWSAPVVPSSAA